MLLGGKGCQNCGCVPCNDCAQTCVNPHTGNAFATVYHYYVLGAEAGNTSDTYLTASGDVDTSDPYDGMDGTGPWYQEISGGFNFYPGVTRFPCVLRFSFWRNNFPLGPTTVPPPSGTLTANAITVTCQSGAVRVGDHIVNAGETYTTGATVPLVSGAGDQSGADPRSYDGTVSVSPVCDTAGFSIKARIDWNTKKRQHILYGTVRECYEIGTPCATACSGIGSPETLYLTISNYTGLAPDSPYVVEGTYVVERVANTCDSYNNVWMPEGGCLFYIFDNYVNVSPSGLAMLHATKASGDCVAILLTASFGNVSLCDADLPISGTNGVAYQAIYSGANYTTTIKGAFDWEVSS